MKLWFERATSDPWDVAIVEATRPGEFCHVELELDGVGFFSSDRIRGVRILDSLDTSDASLWVPLNLDGICRQTPEVVAWCASQCGGSYNYRGAFFSAIGRARQRAGYGFCAGISYLAVVLAGLPDMMGGFLPHPNGLAMLVQAVLAGHDVRAMTRAMVQRAAPQPDALKKLYQLAWQAESER